MKKGTHSIHQDSFEAITFWAMVVVVIAGVYFRLKGLGKWSFANDEYYLAQSVRYILHTGLPQFPCGGYYTRGLIYQYFMVPFIALGFKPELVFRLVPVAAHIIALPGLYILSKKVIGKIGACLLISIFSLSLIEVEISRFARMYLPFQAIFIWYLNFLYRYMIEDDTKCFRWMIMLSFLSVFVFEGGVFLVVLNFLPFFKNKGLPLGRVTISISVFLIAYLFLTTDFRFFPMESSSFFPEDLTASATSSGGRISWPHPLALAIHQSLWLIPFLVVMGISAWGIYKILLNTELNTMARIGLVACVGFALCNLFGLLILAILFLLLMDLIRIEDLKSRLVKVFFLPVLLNLFFFIVYGLSNLGTYGFLPMMQHGAVDSLVAAIFHKIPDSAPYVAKLVNLALALFYYPVGLPGILYGWIKAYPLLIGVMALLTLSGIAMSVFSSAHRSPSFRLFAVVFILLLFLLGVLNIGKATRYSFFLYPVLIMLSISGLESVATWMVKSPMKAKIASTILFSLIFLTSSDFNLDHLIKIDTARYTFRQELGQRLTTHFIMRRDYKNAAEYIDKHVQKDEIVISAHQSIDYYTKKVNFILFGMEHDNFTAYSACGGKKDRWTNLDLIYSLDQLNDILRRSRKNTWIVLNLHTRRYDEAHAIRTFKEDLVYTAPDGIIGIFKVKSAM